MICNTYTATFHYLKFLWLPWDLEETCKADWNLLFQLLHRPLRGPHSLSYALKMWTKIVHFFQTKWEMERDSRRETASNSLALIYQRLPHPGTQPSCWQHCWELLEPEETRQSLIWCFSTSKSGFCLHCFSWELYLTTEYLIQSLFFFFLNPRGLHSPGNLKNHSSCIYLWADKALHSSLKMPRHHYSNVWEHLLKSTPWQASIPTEAFSLWQHKQGGHSHGQQHQGAGLMPLPYIWGITSSSFPPQLRKGVQHSPAVPLLLLCWQRHSKEVLPATPFHINPPALTR